MKVQICTNYHKTTQKKAILQKKPFKKGFKVY